MVLLGGSWICFFGGFSVERMEKGNLSMGWRESVREVFGY